MRLGKLLTAIHQDLPVTPRHEQWLSENPNATYTAEAKSFLAVEIGKPQRDRSTAFSASGATQCPRRRIFSFLGIPEDQKVSARTVSIFHNGTFMHLRWQLAGISAGWLAQPEAFAADPGLRVKGSLDGILDTGEGLELKSINSNGFNYVMTAQEPKKAHLGQVGTYFLMLPDVEAFSVIYENKDTQDYKEFVVRRTPAILASAKDELSKLNDHVEDQTLPEVKDLCWAKQGSEYLQCPFRATCPEVTSWTQASELAAEKAPTPAKDSTGSRSSGLRLRLMSSSPDA